MDCLARSIALKAVYLVLAWVLMVSYQVFTQTALTTVTFSLGGSIPAFSLIDKFKSRSDYLHLFIRLDVCLIISDLNFHVWKRKKTHHSISSKFGTHPYWLSFVGLLHLVGLALSNPSVLSQPFTLLFSNVFFAFFYLALPFIFMVAVDLGLMKIRK
jgi:hypothetical protein